MKNKPYKVKVSVSPDEDIIQIIKDLAEQDDRNFSSYINKVFIFIFHPVHILSLIIVSFALLQFKRIAFFIFGNCSVLDQLCIQNP